MISYISNQYYEINRDFVTNNNVKVIHVSGKAEGEATAPIELNDHEQINELLREKDLIQKAKAYPIFVLPNIFNTSMDSSYSLISLNEELAFLISDGCTLKDNRICIREGNHEQITLKIPIIEEKDDGFSSSKTVDMAITTEGKAKNENAILIHPIPTNNQAYVNENTAKELTKIMYENSQYSLENIQATQLDKIIVYVKDITDVDQVGTLLKEHNYFTSYTFNSFENFSANISSSQLILIVLSIFIVFTSTMIAILFMINFLRIQRREIAIFKLNKYDTKSIINIYTTLVFIMLRNIFIFSLIIYLCHYFFQIVPFSLKEVMFVIIVDLMILLLTFIIVYFFGIKKICNINMIDLLKKEQEID